VPFSLTCGLLGVLRPIIEIPMLPMFHPGEDLALGGSVAFEFIGDNCSGDVGQPLKQLTEELLGSFLIPTTLPQEIKHVPVLINGSPPIVILALDRQKHLIPVPFIAGPRTATMELSGIVLAKLAPPFADGFIRDDHAAFKQQFFDIPEAQAETKVEPDGVANDLDRKAVVLIARGWR
jgi:hypothetical protein